MRSVRGGTVLVTGASGLVGGEVVDRLLRSGFAVLALLHERSEILKNNGSPVSTVGGGLTVLSGDVTEPRLGLDTMEYRHALSEIDAVVHCAAVTSFGLPREIYQRANLLGTRRVLEFCAGSARDIPLVHVSTAYVVGDRHGHVAEEHANRFWPSTRNFYEESKYQGELAIHEAQMTGKTVIVRPSIIAGAEKTGRVRQFDNFYMAVRSATDGHVRSIPGDYAATLNIVPIDYVADCIASALTHIDQLRGSVMHAVSRSPLALADFSTVLAEYSEFFVPRFLTTESFMAAERSPMERRIYAAVMRHYEPYFIRAAEFETTVAMRLTGRVPNGGKPYLRRLLDFALSADFLGRRTGTSRQLATS
jgi:nucleoside-diphosphate-sugar epimerase